MPFFCSIWAVAGVLSMIFNGLEVSAQSTFHERLEVDMVLNPLNLGYGREASVPCRINRSILDLVNSTVEFIQIPNHTEAYFERVLTRNGMLVDADPELYGIEVISGYYETTFRLDFRNPGLQDEGYLLCRLTPGPGVGSPSIRTITTSRYVLVFGSPQ